MFPPADAIDTVNVVTNSFDAEQGMAGGAAVNVQIKSGTNSLHGSAHEFHTDQNFVARNYFLTDPKFTKNVNIQNQYGGSPGNAAVAGSIPGEGGLCNTGSNNNFGVITNTLSPGGFFGPDPGNRTVWLGASLTF
jgi:hypothetical protein